jgi:hypothetical protein
MPKGGKVNSPRLWSVWNLMQALDAWKLGRMLYLIECARRDGIKYEIQTKHRDAEATETFLSDWVHPILEDARALAQKNELSSTNDRVAEMGAFTLNLPSITYENLDAELRVLSESVRSDLGKKYAYTVPENKHDYLAKDFTLDMWGRPGFYFPTIRQDAFAAMRCYAFDLNTACVFHLMRITEIGLRALARRMRVSLPKHKQVEWAQWNEVIIAMSKKADVIGNTRRAGKAKDDLLEFYRGAIGEVQGFKDAYRNFVMHMREKSSYDEGEARSLLTRVSHFMDRLSGRIDENGRALTERRRKKMFAEIDARIEAEKEKQKQDEQAKQGIPELRHDDAEAD